MAEESIKEKIRGANERYHRVIDLLMQDETVDVSYKAQVGVKADAVFRFMSEINAILDIVYPEG